MCMVLVNDQLDALFSLYLFYATTCFEKQVLIIRRIKLCQYIIWYNTFYWVGDCVPVSTQSPTRMYYIR